MWDKSAEKLAYLAEKKVAKAKPFFTSNVKIVNDEKSDDKKKAEVKVTHYQKNKFLNKKN